MIVRTAIVLVWLGALAGALDGAGQAPLRAPVAATGAATPEGARALLDRYCVTCHSTRLKTGDLVLEGLDLHRVAASPEVWEKVIRKVRAGVMPPQGMPRPPGVDLTAFVTGLETALDREGEFL